MNEACAESTAGQDETPATPDPDLDNNCAASENLVLQKADLRIVKFGKEDGVVRAGDVLTYTVIVDNLGPSYANNVALKDVLQIGRRVRSDRHPHATATRCASACRDRARRCRLAPTAWPIVDPPPARRRRRVRAVWRTSSSGWRSTAA